MSQAADQVIQFFENMQEQAETLTKKERGELLDKVRESIS